VWGRAGHTRPSIKVNLIQPKHASFSPTHRQVVCSRGSPTPFPLPSQHRLFLSTASIPSSGAAVSQISLTASAWLRMLLLVVRLTTPADSGSINPQISTASESVGCREYEMTSNEPRRGSGVCLDSHYTVRSRHVLN